MATGVSENSKGRVCRVARRIIYYLILAGSLHFTSGVAATAQQPHPDIRANNGNTALNLSSNESLGIRISLDPGALGGAAADWWIIAHTPFGLVHYEPAARGWRGGVSVSSQAALSEVPSLEVLDTSGLPAGTYVFYFGVDLDVNGAIDTGTLVFDYIPVTISDAAGVWRPSPGTSWQWQLSGAIDTSFDVEMYDIDLFDTDQGIIDRLHRDGRVVICYFSAGSREEWRRDAALFPDRVLGKPLDGWPGEKWLDIRDMTVLGPILAARLDLAVQKGCDGVEPDNVDGYLNDTGFPLTAEDQLVFNRWLADAAHRRNLSVGLKNDLDQVEALAPWFDWALNEQCFEFDECDALLPFVSAGKAVFGVEYNLDAADFCDQANRLDFDWLRKNPELDAERTSCR